MDWVYFDFANTVTIEYGSYYWIVVGRSGTSDTENFYNVDLDEQAEYTDGILRVWDGSAWQARWTDADMAFRVLGAEETTAQISTMANGTGDITAVEILDASGIYGNQYRDGDTTAYDEVMALLDAGTSNNARLLARVTPEARLQLYEQDDIASLYYTMLRSDGTLRESTGASLPHGLLPYARWIVLEDLPSVLGHLADISPFFVRRAQYNVTDGTYVLEPQGMRTPWDATEVSQG
jgi:hypothetical protein